MVKENRAKIEESATKELSALVKRTNKADPAPADVAELREILKRMPDVAKQYGDLSQMVFTEVLHTCYDRQVLLREAIKQQGENMVEEFDYDRASPMEKLLIQQIVLNWLRYHETEMRWHMVSKDDPTIAQAEHWQRRLSMAQSRYLRAIETLARVKKLQQKPPNPALNILLKQQLKG